LKLTTAGRLVLWLGICLLAVSALLSSTLVLLSAALLFLYLLIEGLSFHRAVALAKDLVKVESRPSTIETAIGRPFKVETVVTNDSPSEFSVVRFSHDLPPQIDEVRDPPSLTLQSNGRQHTETILRTNLPGRFEITTSTTFLERRSHLFSQAVVFPNKVIIMARPVINRSVDPIETGALEDLVADHRRMGSGTDFVGIRPYNIQDNFHRIDWKATARLGKLMTRESYLERDPTIILVVDVSHSMNTRRGGPSVLEAFLNEASNFLAAIPIASPMGLILYGRQEVVASIEPMQGAGSRERILHTLLERSKAASVSMSPQRGSIRTYADLTQSTNSLMRESESAVRSKGYLERLSALATFIVPFYERAQSKYFERVREEGAFKAFKIVRDFPEPVLVIVISDGETNIDGLADGARNARMLNHRVVLAVVAVAESAKRIEVLSDLVSQGVGFLRCRPEELSRAINAEILRSSHSRTTLVKAPR
jgi:uncharacterized protein (DUF58 family)